MDNGVVVSPKQFLSAAPSSSLSPAPAWAFPVVLQDNLVRHRVLHRLQCGYLLQPRLSKGAQGSLSPAAGTLPPHLLQPWCPQGCFSLFFLSLLAACVAFLPLLKCPFKKAPPPSLRGSAVPCGGAVVELAGTGRNRHGAAQPLLRELGPAAPAASTRARTPTTIGKEKRTQSIFFYYHFLNPDYCSLIIVILSFFFHSFIFRLYIKPQREKTALLLFGLRGVFGSVCVHIHTCHSFYHRMLRRPRQACKAEYMTTKTTCGMSGWVDFNVLMLG